MAGDAAPAAPPPAPPPLSLDGGLSLRLIEPADEPRLVAMYARLSRHTAYQRFFAAMQRLPPDWAHFFANVDYRTRLALVIERRAGDETQLVAVGRYEPTALPDVAEVAFVVQDGWQGQGLGRLLLRELLAAAAARGIRRFRAYVLADNHRMLRLLDRHTRVLERSVSAGVAELLFEPLEPPRPGWEPPPATG
ncbi:MAG: GNAT family N-acetyltransferase [Candidatus Rokubacteria bacterium]|nr:GNAT family N-acetyltransferase [Candidatus Rokubacteria bacterium]